jgi:hypothetical protein
MSVYEIRVKGHLDPRWSELFDGFRITNDEYECWGYRAAAHTGWSRR